MLHSVQVKLKQQYLWHKNNNEEKEACSYSNQKTKSEALTMLINRVHL